MRPCRDTGLDKPVVHAEQDLQRLQFGVLCSGADAAINDDIHISVDVVWPDDALPVCDAHDGLLVAECLVEEYQPPEQL